MDGMNKLVVALLIVAIIFSVISITLILGLADFNIKAPANAVAQAVQGNQAGKVNLYVVSNTGGAP